MASEFETSVEYGLKLSKRIFYGKEPTPAPAPAPAPAMSRKPESYLPTAVTVYVLVPEPEAVDNPDVPSYQPYVHGRCQPPAMIPLHMHGVAMEVDCCLDYASISVSGTWRVHCIKTSSKCDCRIAVPMGDQGSLLGVEVDVTGRSWHSQLITTEDAKEKEKISQSGEGRYLKGSIYTFKIPQVDGGSIISIRVTWSQKLSYNEGKFSLSVPFSFPSFVNPIGKKISKREKILLNVDSATDREIVCKSDSHALKELRRDIGKMGFLYESEVMKWSSSNFSFSYSHASNELFGGMLLRSPLLQDFDDRQIFCFYLFPGDDQRWKAFRKELIFLIDISGSMKGPPLESVKNALLASLSTLNPEDSFNIIAFNGDTYSFSSLMEPATQDAILKATQWLNDNLLADGGTNILLPIKQAFKLLADATDSIPLIFLVTDGAVEDEKEIYNFVKGSLAHGQSISPRICTFGIGTYCNHYFLQKLAQIGRGHFDSAYDSDSVDFRMQRLFTTGSSVILANVSADAFKCLDSLELFPSSIPDLLHGSPLILSGRYTGNFLDTVKINGTLGDMGNFVMDLKVQKAKDFPVDMVLARRQIDALTTEAWLSESNNLKEKVARVSIQTRVPSEYTRMILLQADGGEKAPETILVQQVANRMNPLKQVDVEGHKIIYLGSLGVGFGNMIATAENVPPGSEEGRPLEATEMLVKAASKCCSRLLDRCCCMCFIQTCTYMNNQCSVVLAQLCAALACFECLDCCYELFG